MYRLLLYITLSMMGVQFDALMTSPPGPILISEANSTRAIALTSLTGLREPFSATTDLAIYGADHRTRICVFVMNLALQPGEDASALTADAEDVNHQHYALVVESAAEIPGQTWMRQLVLRLNEELVNQGDVLVKITYHAVSSNRVRIAIGHVGGGPPDDPGAGPTPGQLFFIKGNLSLTGQPLANVSVTVNGPQSQIVITDSAGNYTIPANVTGDYTVTPSSNFYSFSPTTITLTGINVTQTANFTGTLKSYNISGRIVSDDDLPLPNINVPLISTNGIISRSATTDADGRYAISDLPATYDYVFTPNSSTVFDFAQQTVKTLGSDQIVNVTGVRKLFTLTGTIRDRSLTRIASATVSITGAVNKTTTTDADGNYTLTQIPAGRDYQLTPSKTDYIFEPQSQALSFLQQPQLINFTAIRTYTISGTVTNGSSRGLIGIKLSVSGPQSGTVTTSANGTYAFVATAPGTYTVKPQSDQSYVPFTPISQTLSVTANWSADFAAPMYVLDFDGSPKLVNYDVFWPEGVDLGHFFWEFWAMPGDNADARYMLSDGFGGSHALLFGFVVRTDLSRYDLFGNVWNGTASTYFVGGDGPAPHEWGHFAVGWDGNNIITYVNGVPVGKQPFTGPRRSMGPGWGAGWLYIGGSDHQNLIGRLSQVRGYDGSNPRESAPEAAFTPQSIFSGDGNMASQFFNPTQSVSDLSAGYNGSKHTGLLQGVPDGFLQPCPTCPGPTYILDPSAPAFTNLVNPGPIDATVGPAPRTPDGARIFDSFSRANSTYILGGKGGLASTESGFAGVKTWTTNVDSAQPQPFGILNGKAVLLGNAPSLAWVATGSPSANVDVHVTRRPLVLANSGQNTGVAFRVQDSDNYFFAYSSDDPADTTRPKKLTVGYYQAGVRSVVTSTISFPSDWSVLRVVTLQSGSISVYADDTFLFTVTNPLFASSTGAGIYNCGPNMGLTNRWDNFTVFDVQ